MTKGIVLSLYDYTGEALKPWAEAGYALRKLKGCTDVFMGQ